jgi:hypothetical protein
VSLLDNLVSYWKLDEASGDALDAHGANDLTDNNTVGSATGKINNGRDFEKDSAEYFSIADNADLSTGDIDFTGCLWVKFESTPTANQYLMIKGNEYNLLYENSGSQNRLSLYVANFALRIGTFAPTLDTWHFIVFWHDAAGNTLNIQVDNGTPESSATGGTAPSDDTGVFQLGAVSGGTETFDGVMDEVGFWKRVLTADERTELYNSGNGLSYDDFAGGAAVVVGSGLTRSLKLQRRRLVAA